MANQTFKPEEREAFWEIYDRKCFYHERLIEFDDLEIDHVVPEKLLSLSENERKKKLKELGLKPSFDICAYENLVASCGKCNRDKHHNGLPLGQLAIFLSIAAKKAPKIRKEVEAVRKTRSLNDLTRAIQRSVNNGVFTGQELVENLKSLGIVQYLNTGQANGVNTPVLVLRASDSITSPVPDLIFINSKARRDFSDSGMTADDILTMINDPHAKVISTPENNEEVVKIIVDDRFFLKYVVRGQQTLIHSCHFIRF